MPTWHSYAYALGVAEMDDTHEAFMRELAILQRASDEDFPRLFDELHRHLRAGGLPQSLQRCRACLI